VHFTRAIVRPPGRNFASGLTSAADGRIAYLGDGVWVGCREIERELKALGGFDIRELISVAATESYAANCVRVNESVPVPAGYPRITQALDLKGLHPLPLEMSEFKKMDGGLSCLSLRF
jgi:dimethylargininase